MQKHQAKQPTQIDDAAALAIFKRLPAFAKEKLIDKADGMLMMAEAYRQQTPDTQQKVDENRTTG